MHTSKINFMSNFGRTFNLNLRVAAVLLYRSYPLNAYHRREENSIKNKFKECFEEQLWLRDRKKILSAGKLSYTNMSVFPIQELSLLEWCVDGKTRFETRVWRLASRWCYTTRNQWRFTFINFRNNIKWMRNRCILNAIK